MAQKRKREVKDEGKIHKAEGKRKRAEKHDESELESHVKMEVISDHDRSSSHNQRTMFLRDWKSHNPGLCCICIRGTLDLDEMVTCNGPDCAVSVHRTCYDVEGKDASKWMCDRCRADDPALAACALCPCRDGALKQISGTNYWIHVLCMQWTLGARDDDRVCEENLYHLDPKCWNKECSVCTSPINKQYGGKCPCDAAQCKNLVHATCAADYHLLEEVTDSPDMAHPYFVYCKQHGSNDPRLNPWAKWVQNKHRGLAKIAENERKTPISQARLNDPRAVLENSLAIFNDGQELNILRMQHDAVQSRAECAAYEKAVVKLQRDLKNTDTNIEEATQELEQLANEDEALRDDLLTIFECFQPTNSASPVSRDTVIDRLFQLGPQIQVRPEFESAFVSAYTTAQHQQRLGGDDKCLSELANKRKRRGRRENAAHPSSGCGVFGLCTICKTFEGGEASGSGLDGTDVPSSPEVKTSPPASDGINVHRLIQCAQCVRCFHMGCLDPPMTKVPSRGYTWRCEDCDTSPNEEDKTPNKRKLDDEQSMVDEGRPKRIRAVPARYTA
ncbi:hypothetical protein SpCBS45565_g00863 [Spizellomyces sp. 'palustris']|nr:hypothetical protein SpCBS45565_g00863 [Spizellomyces sp. 'palustris']